MGGKKDTCRGFRLSTDETHAAGIRRNLIKTLTIIARKQMR